MHTQERMIEVETRLRQEIKKCVCIHCSNLVIVSPVLIVIRFFSNHILYFLFRAFGLQAQRDDDVGFKLFSLALFLL